LYALTQADLEMIAREAADAIPAACRIDFTIEFQTMFLSVFLSQSGLAT
jgi:hypothetical protein